MAITVNIYYTGENAREFAEEMMSSGVVDEIDREKNKVRVTISMFGRETPVELELEQAELMD